MKIHPVAADLSHAEGRRDRRTERHDKDISPFTKFCNRSAKSLCIIFCILFTQYNEN